MIEIVICEKRYSVHRRPEDKRRITA